MQEESGGSQGDGYQDGRNRNFTPFTLVDQTVPQPPQEILTYPVPPGYNAYYGQARYTQRENMDSDSASLPYQIVQNIDPTIQGPPLHRLSISGMDDRHDRSLSSNLHCQSASGFSDPAMNQPPRGHLQPLHPQNDGRLECMFPNQATDAEKLLYHCNGDTLKCLKCKEIHRVGTTFIHKEYCPGNRVLKVTQDNRDQGNQDRGQVETNGINGNHDGQRNKRYQTPTASFPPSIPSMLPGRQQIGEERGAVGGAAGGVAPTGASSLGDTSVKSAFRRENSEHTEPRYDSKESRLQTFHNWKHGHVQSPKSLADAGMYYTGNGDACKCHECEIDLRQWEVGDDPWYEHARHNPVCPYILRRKGQDFVEDVVRKETEDEFRTAPTSFQSTRTNGESQLGKSSSMSRKDFVEILTTMGFKADQIQRAIQEFTRANAMKEPFVDELVDLIIKQSDGNEGALMDPSICCGCNQGRASCAQYECGHIVCAKCAPSVKGGPCKVCGNKVVRVCPVDTNHLLKKI